MPLETNPSWELPLKVAGVLAGIIVLVCSGLIMA